MMSVLGLQVTDGVAQLALFPQELLQLHVLVWSQLPDALQEHDGVAHVGLSAVQPLEFEQEPVDPSDPLKVPLMTHVRPSPAGHLLVELALQLAENPVLPGSQFGGLQEHDLVSASQR